MISCSALLKAPRRATLAVAALLAGLIRGHSALAAPVPAALFPFELDDTSLEGEMRGSAGEDARLAMLNSELPALLRKQGYTPVDLAPVAAQAHASVFRTCDGCDVDLARKVGAQVSVVGWVQKVSSLILNVNLVIRDVATGKVIRGGSADIRGDTDVSWSRGLKYLIDDRLFPQSATGGAAPK